MSGKTQQQLRNAEALLDNGLPTDCANAFDLAELAGADADRCSAGRWIRAMQRGDFESAWLQSDAIRHRGAPDPARFWQGENIRNRDVIVRCLHGLGDAVQFLCYAPLLRELTETLIVEVPPQLTELASHLRGIEKVITWGELAPVVQPKWDVQVEVTELPYLFRTQLSDLPIAANYLRLPHSIIDSVKPRPTLRTNLRVGIVWASGEWKPSRSLPLDLMISLMQTPGCEFWNLQGERARCEWRQVPKHDRMHDDSESCDTVMRLAALIAQLDLVITPDTLAAHLAGALGIQAWVMLEYAADWRWMHLRENSPWYPSLRLFRQRTQDDWISVIEQIHDELPQLVQAQRRLIA
jgi:hypothetical protein